MRLFAKGPLSGLRAFILALLSLAMMSLDHRLAYFDQVRAALSSVVVPLQLIVDKPMALLQALSSTITRQRMLAEENARLRSTQLLVQGELQKLMSLQKENEALHALLGSSQDVRGEVQIARLLAVDMAPFIYEVKLNKGSNDNVYVGQPVVDAHGVMGQIISVTEGTSTLLLLTDQRSAIPVEVNRNGMRTIAIGTGYADELALLYVPLTADIELGDLLITSGLGQSFPSGYPVGVVSDIRREPGERFLTIKVKTAAALHTSRQVLLVWPKSRQVQDNV